MKKAVWFVDHDYTARSRRDDHIEQSQNLTYTGSAFRERNRNAFTRRTISIIAHDHRDLRCVVRYGSRSNVVYRREDLLNESHVVAVLNWEGAHLQQY